MSPPLPPYKGNNEAPLERGGLHAYINEQADHSPQADIRKIFSSKQRRLRQK
jgi:hypothetical protein